jgi:hypothetical protein
MQLSLPVQPVIGSHGTLVVSQTVATATPTDVLLSASDPNIAIQPSVTIPAGNLSVSVPFTIGAAFDSSRVFSFTSHLGAQSASVYSYQTTTSFAGFRLFTLLAKTMAPPGGAGGFGIGVTSYGGYTSTAQLSCQGLPAGVSCLFNNPLVNVVPGLDGAGSGLTIQVAPAVPLGAYVFQVVGTDGVVTDVLPLRLQVADFSVKFSPASVTVQTGTPANFTLEVGSIGGWNDFVEVQCQVSPPDRGVFCPVGTIIFPGIYPGQVNTNSATPGDYTFSVSATSRGVTHTSPPAVLHVNPIGVAISSFIPVAPCRIADTRNPAGPFGGPFLHGGGTRSFVIPSSSCGLPASALAYSLNVTVVPHGILGFLTMFPCGEPLPLASTLNSIDGRVKATGAIMPAGLNGAVCVFATNDTELVLDINGYFGPPSDPAGLAFYPLAPCRLVDTRLAAGPLGGPSLTGNGPGRTFPIHASPCNVPPAQAYSLNFTSVPKGPLGFLTTWPTGQPQPFVSTLNALTGAITANAAIVPAGTNGDINVFVTNDSDLVIDINGYFAPPGPGGLLLYTISPCRVLDTRNPAPTGGKPFSGILDVNVAGSSCGAPATAQAFVLNATVVPPGLLGFLTLWPQGAAQPLVSTLNALDGAITSNMALVPAGLNGFISAWALNPTHIILDTSGYFAP